MCGRWATAAFSPCTTRSTGVKSPVFGQRRRVRSDEAGFPASFASSSSKPSFPQIRGLPAPPDDGSSSSRSERECRIEQLRHESHLGRDSDPDIQDAHLPRSAASSGYCNRPWPTSAIKGGSISPASGRARTPSLPAAQATGARLRPFCWAFPRPARCRSMPRAFYSQHYWAGFCPGRLARHAEADGEPRPALGPGAAGHGTLQPPDRPLRSHGDQSDQRLGAGGLCEHSGELQSNSGVQILTQQFCPPPPSR